MNAGVPATVAGFIAVAIWMWLAMLLTHELGHVVAAMITGGTVIAVELRPGWLPHTLVDPNPQPSFVLWGGFLSGWIVPQMTAPAWRIRAGFVGPVLRAWAAFCLLAGGVYLAFGGAERLTDSGQLLANDWPLAPLIAVGVAISVIGYARSRGSWIAIAQHVEAKPMTWRLAFAWWCWLAAWAAGQGVLHATVQPSQ